MPTGRIILKSISESKKLALLSSDSARLLYTWLIPHVDVNGCFSGDPDVIRGQVFTRLNKTNEEIEAYLIDLESVGLVIRYASNGDIFIYLPTFGEKQPHLNPDREAKPRIPLPTQDQLKTNSRPTQDKLPLKVKEKVKLKENTVALEFEQFWSAYPLKDGKQDALKAFSSLRRSGVELADIAKAFNGYMEYLKDKRLKENFAQSPKHAATFLRDDRWREFIDYKSTPKL